MNTYILQKDLILNTPINSIKRNDGWVIPFAPDNTDYQQFKKDLQSGASLIDSTGTTMTADQITTFLGSLK